PAGPTRRGWPGSGCAASATPPRPTTWPAAWARWSPARACASTTTPAPALGWAPATSAGALWPSRCSTPIPPRSAVNSDPEPARRGRGYARLGRGGPVGAARAALDRDAERPGGAGGDQRLARRAIGHDLRAEGPAHALELLVHL